MFTSYSRSKHVTLCLTMVFTVKILYYLQKSTLKGIFGYVGANYMLR